MNREKSVLNFKSKTNRDLELPTKRWEGCRLGTGPWLNPRLLFDDNDVKNYRRHFNP